jgi:hypothetical protein
MGPSTERDLLTHIPHPLCGADRTLTNVVDQTQALHELKLAGSPFKLSDLGHLSPYSTRHLKRFGDYPTQLSPDPAPQLRMLPA